MPHFTGRYDWSQKLRATKPIGVIIFVNICVISFFLIELSGYLRLECILNPQKPLRHSVSTWIAFAPVSGNVPDTPVAAAGWKPLLWRGNSRLQCGAYALQQVQPSPRLEGASNMEFGLPSYRDNLLLVTVSWRNRELMLGNCSACMLTLSIQRRGRLI